MPYRVLNMPVDYAASRGNVVVSCVMDGPKEGSSFGSVLQCWVDEVVSLSPLAAAGRDACIPPGVHYVASRLPASVAAAILVSVLAGYQKARLTAPMWKHHGEGDMELEEVGVFVLWTGTMADLPMRCKLYRNVHWAATHACDQCGIQGSRPDRAPPTRFFGCRTPVHPCRPQCSALPC